MDPDSDPYGRKKVLDTVPHPALLYTRQKLASEISEKSDGGNYRI